jgi:hypothetical protein
MKNMTPYWWTLPVLLALAAMLLGSLCQAQQNLDWEQVQYRPFRRTLGPKMLPVALDRVHRWIVLSYHPLTPKVQEDTVQYSITWRHQQEIKAPFNGMKHVSLDMLVTVGIDPLGHGYVITTNDLYINCSSYKELGHVVHVEDVQRDLDRMIRRLEHDLDRLLQVDPAGVFTSQVEAGPY